jgi:hypothetical protein
VAAADMSAQATRDANQLSKAASAKRRRNRLTVEHQEHVAAALHLIPAPGGSLVGKQYHHIVGKHVRFMHVNRHLYVIKCS